MRTEAGEATYQDLIAEGSTVIVRPLYFSFLNIANMCDDKDSPAKLYAKQLMIHSMDYQEQINPFRTEKNSTSDEAIVLSAGFANLEALLHKTPDGKKVERHLLRPSDIEKKLDVPSISMFWASLKEILDNHPEYLSDSDWFYELGKEIGEVVTDITQAPKPRIEVSPLDEKKFSNGVFFQLRAEMRKIKQVVDKYAK